ncbi:nucleotidyltransferase domain-containing protein [Candidatus Pacearchaeota archaeon]|nr:nucleotidyltransferase domain-containing protein [Candidatus Pacearchaeota archaeon]
MIFPTSKAEYKIIKEIYENPGINISTLLKKTRTSPQAGYKYIKELLKAQIIKEAKEGEKPILRRFYPNFSEVGKLIFALIEENKKQDFLNIHPIFKGAIIQFEKEIIDQVDCVLIFGSFARKSETKESDVDMLVLGKKEIKKYIEKLTERAFITIRNKISLRFNKTKDFIKKIENNDSFAVQIQKEHVVTVNAKKWVEIVSEL